MPNARLPAPAARSSAADSAGLAASGAHDLRDGDAAALLARFLNTNLKPVPRVTTAAVMRRAQEYQRGSFKKDRAQEEQEEERAERISGTLEADPPVTAGLSTRDAIAAATAVVALNALSDTLR